MIRYCSGNIFEANTECIVNTVNCEGYMGKGIAYQFKLKYPENNREYVKACKSGKLRIGSIHHFHEDGITIVNFPTKNKWREKSRIDYIDVGLDRLSEFIISQRIGSIAIPPLGCGNGGLNWAEVRSLIEKKLSVIGNKVDILVFEPSTSFKATPKEPPKMTLASLVLLQIKMHLRKFGSLRLQKTAYFMNYFLNDDYFKFEKNHYGPYSHSIDIVSKSIKEYQNYYGLTKADETYKHIFNVICSKKIEDKIAVILPAIEKASSLVNSIGTNKFLEGIATVHYLVKKNNSNFNRKLLIDAFKNWSYDKGNRFNAEDIEACIDYLEQSGIIFKNICGLYESCDYKMLTPGYNGTLCQDNI